MSRAFTPKVPVWLGSNSKQADIILSTRVRLARNIKNIPFTNWASDAGHKRVLEIIKNVKQSSPVINKLKSYNFQQISVSNQKFLVERHQVSPAFLNMSNRRGILISEDEGTSVMVNEEDHLRIQVLNSALSINKTWNQAKQIDEEIAQNVKYSYSDRYGYLTACPTNVGSAVRISFFCHLPGLALNKQMDDFLKYMIPAGIAIRGIYGEGSEMVGSIFQISNQTTLGFSEEEILNRIEVVSKKILAMERKARRDLYKDAGIIIDDKVHRAIGILQNAKLLGSLELLSLISAIRLGSSLGITKEIPPSVLNKLVVLSQPMHIRKMCKGVKSYQEIDAFRADYVRAKLKLKSIV